MSSLHQPPFSLSDARRRRSVAVLLALALSFTGITLAGEGRKYATLILKDGRQLSGVEIVTYTTTDVLVRHSGGATSLRTDVLPNQVIVDLHLPPPLTAEAIASDPAFLALAEKIAAPAAIVAPAHNQPSAPLPVNVPAPAPVADTDSNVSAAQLLAATRPEPANTPAAPAGEGNLTSFAATPHAMVAAPKSTWVNLPGRVAVTLPTGETHLLADVEVRAYPADLLTRYLTEAQVRSAEVAQQLRSQAAGEAQQGRLAESDALNARAAKAAANYLDFIPTAPATARSDAYGHFTLRHELRNPRLVAVGRINVSGGEWTYAWIGLAPGAEALLTEANATVVSAPEGSAPRLAVR